MASRWRRSTVNTLFHIDMDWWTDQNRDIRVMMRDCLCDQCRADFAGADLDGSGEIDWVDEETGEVSRVDGLWHAIRTCCSLDPGYITPSTPIVEGVFRTFLANGNKPLSILELYELLDKRPPRTLLRMLTAGQVYLGIRPVRE